MPQTDGNWKSRTAFNDMQIFVGVSDFIDTAAKATMDPGFAWALAATNEAVFMADVSAVVRRLGEYAIPLWTGVTPNPGATQNAFGTAASEPGPSHVAGTSDPLALKPGVPPQPAANLATLGAFQTGPIPKGIKITSVDVIYNIDTADASAASVLLASQSFTDGGVPVITVLIAPTVVPLVAKALGAVYVANVPVAVPAFEVTADSRTLINFDITAGAGGTVTFYGVVLHCDFNFN
jgi:hypothetical protein